MTSKGALKWLERLKEPRTIESLISEVYGEAAWYGCLFERAVADMLNYHDLASDPISWLSNKPFDNENWSLSQLVKEVKKRGISEEHWAVLDEGRDARNELIHRLVATELVISAAEKEMLLARIDNLYFRVWRAYRLANGMIKEMATRVGISDERVRAAVKKMKEEARIEDENITQILGLDENPEKG